VALVIHNEFYNGHSLNQTRFLMFYLFDRNKFRTIVIYKSFHPSSTVLSVSSSSTSPPSFPLTIFH